MCRKEKESFCLESSLEFETDMRDDWNLLSDEQLEKYVEWFDYLWTK
jgi:hypothetical protein